MKKLVVALMTAGILAGCASFPENYEKPVTVNDITAELRDNWSSSPAISFIKSYTGSVKRLHQAIPDDVSGKLVSLEFSKMANVTLGDVLFALRAKGIRVVSRLDQESLSRPWMHYTYNATLSDLIMEITDTNNLGYEYRRGTVYLVETNQYSAAMPQHKEFLEQVETSLKAMGATDVRPDMQAGMMHYSAKPDVADRLEDYLDRVSKNSAMVKLQVAVLTVGMNRDYNLGLDWTKLMAQYGTKDMRPSLNPPLGEASPGAGGVAGGGTTPGTGNVAEDTAKAVAKLGSLVSMVGGDGVGLRFASDAFSLTAAIKALSTYGNARTEQNVVIGTLSGLPVKISSGNDIPYVKSIGATTAAGGATQGSSQTEIIKSGLKLSVTPYFDASDLTVMTDIKVDLSSLVGFRELSAGQNLGTLSQPEMQNLEFENSARTLVGVTEVMGGITYDQISNNYTNLPGMEKAATGSKAEKTTRNAMYIVVRPTVVIFTPKAEELRMQAAAAAAQAQAVPAIDTKEQPAIAK